MSYATIDDLRSQLGGGPKEPTPEYRAKMMHRLPETNTIADRNTFIVKQCAGKRVLDFGASGTLRDRLREAAADYFGVDREESPGVVAWDLDDVDCHGLPMYSWGPDPLKHIGRPEIIVCGEVLEHLSNPGWFLQRLRKQYEGVPLIVSVPNAFSGVAQYWLGKGFENVNADHVAWYSPTTIATLLQRSGYSVGRLFYYNGAGRVADGPTAEGLIVVTE